MLRWINPYFTLIASIASIVGLIITICSDKNAVIIALISIIVSLLILIVGFVSLIYKVIKQNNKDEYSRISSFFVFRSEDGVRSIFETYRLIQCKKPILTDIEYKYKWSGSVLPKMSSNNQIIEQLPATNDKNKWDTAIIKFKRPLMYNESTVLHIKTENDDSDGTAQPWLECFVLSSIEILQFRVMLGYKPDDYRENAIFERRKKDSDIGTDYEFICHVPFEKTYKQYFHIYINPAPGYIYRLRWKK